MTNTRLGVMMFLEYLIWGSWLPLLALYLGDVLGFSGGQIGWIFATQAIACLAGLYFGGQIADRMLSTEKLLALLHLVGGIAMFALAYQATFWSFFIVMLVYQLAYMPTMSLTNAVVFQHVADPQRDFGRIRLWGTIGWIAASWPFVFILAGKTGADLHAALSSIFTVAGVASIALAAFSLTLPHTPPAKRDGGISAPMQAIGLLRDPMMLVLFVATLMDALVHQCYFQWTSPFLQQAGLAENMIMPAMSVGQIAEIGSMAALGWALARLGWKWTMTIGILAHAARFFVFAIGDPLWLMVGINVVHGMCYAFFFAAVYIFVDERCPKDARASAQGLFNLVILGIGPFAGSLLWGWLGDVFRNADGSIAPAVLALAAALLMMAAFHPRSAAVAARD
jgi:nucleoside transporter